MRPLEEVLAAPSVAICPTACPFTVVCEPWRQKGINKLFISGFYTEPEQCTWFQKMQALAWGYFGIAPKTSEELLDAIRERLAIQQETS